MRRTPSLGLLAVLLLAVSACSSVPGKSPDAPAGCGDCAAETKEVRTRLEGLPQVTELSRVEYTPGKSLRLNPTISVDARIEKGSLEQARPAIVKTIWDSRITPLDNVIVNLVTPDGEVTSLDFAFLDGTDETKAYEETWGPRPVA